MTDIIEDIYKIYLACIASYNARIYQTVNEKYTVIDKAMLTAYLYLKITEDKNVNNKEAAHVLSNYLIKQIIYSETGNISFTLEDKAKETLYQELLDNLILEKFEYKNRILKQLKYDYQPVKVNDYTKLLTFLESIADYAIFNHMLQSGNQTVIPFMRDVKRKITSSIDTLDKNDDFYHEKQQFIALVEKDTLKDSIYGNILHIALNLKEVSRYSAFKLVVEENVLFHHYVVTIISLLLAKYCNENLKENFVIDTILSKSLIHDFTEYTGIEIVGQFKYYNETTKKMFAEIEEEEEMKLKGMIGDNLYTILSQCKHGAEGYLYDLVDKILGITKNWIEVGFFNNNTMIKTISAIYQERFRKFLRINDLDNIQNKEFYIDLLRESYIYMKEHLIEKNINYTYIYYSKEEIQKYIGEITMLKKNPENFLK